MGLLLLWPQVASRGGRGLVLDDMVQAKGVRNDSAWRTNLELCTSAASCCSRVRIIRIVFS